MHPKRFVKFLYHYLPLFGILGAGLLGVLLFSFDRRFQEVVIIATAAGYVSWGVVHHVAHKDLTVGIMAEYFAVALLGLVIIFSILFRT